MSTQQHGGPKDPDRDLQSKDIGGDGPALQPKPKRKNEKPPSITGDGKNAPRP
jgi:hypothetical protein